MVLEKEGGVLSKGMEEEVRKQVFGRFGMDFLLNGLLEWVGAVEGFEALPSYLSVMVRAYLQAQDC